MYCFSKEVACLLPFSVATPMPVVISNLPGPDPATTIAGYATLILTFVAAVAATWGLILQLRKPTLDLSFGGGLKALVYNPSSRRMGDGGWMKFAPELQVSNTGSAPARLGCSVSIWIPVTVEFDLQSVVAGGWSVPAKDLGGDRPLCWRIDRYNSEPVFRNRFVRIPAVTISSPHGAIEFDMLWRLSYEGGVAPKTGLGSLRTGVEA